MEVAQLLGAAQVGMMRAESPDEVHDRRPARARSPRIVRAGMRLPLDGDSVTARVLRTGRSARIDLYEEGDGAIAELARRVERQRHRRRADHGRGRGSGA